MALSRTYLPPCATRSLSHPPKHICRFERCVLLPNLTCEIGQLADRGAAQTRAVGARLCEIQADLFGFLPHDLPSHPNDALYFRNIYQTRTKMSVANAFDDLYPARFRGGKEPVTLVTFPQTIRDLTMNPSAYPKLNAVYHGFLKSPTYAAHIEANAALMMKVDTALGVASNFKYNITPMGDHVQPRLCNNLSLCQVSKPGDCITHKEVLTLIDLTMFIYSGMFQNDGEGVDSMETIKRLGVGPFVKNLANSTWGTLASEKTKGTAKFADLSSSFQSQDQFLAVVGDSSFPWPP